MTRPLCVDCECGGYDPECIHECDAGQIEMCGDCGRPVFGGVDRCECVPVTVQDEHDVWAATVPPRE